MTLQKKKQQSVFPDLPRGRQIADEKGNVTDDWQLGLSALFQAAQKNFKNEGIVFPPLPTTDLNTIQALYTPYIGGEYNTMLQNLPDISGQTVFDSTARVPKQFIITFSGSPAIVNTAAWKTFTLT